MSFAPEAPTQLQAKKLLMPDAVKWELSAKTGKDAVRELHAALLTSPAVLDGNRFLVDLEQRQGLGANCLDQVVAIPHTRTVAVRQIVLAVGRSDTGIYFDAQHPAIRLVFLMGVPIEAVAEYLQWTSQLARALRAPDSRRLFLEASEEELIRSWPYNLSRPAA